MLSRQIHRPMTTGPIIPAASSRVPWGSWRPLLRIGAFRSSAPSPLENFIELLPRRIRDHVPTKYLQAMTR
jgi:hypothetical protein